MFAGISTKPSLGELMDSWVIMTIRQHKASNQCWFIVGQRRRRWTNFKTSLVQRLVFAQKLVHHEDFVSYQQNTGRWPNVGLMLVQRRGRWAKVSPTLGQHLVFAGLCYSNEVLYQTFVQCVRNIYDVASPLWNRAHANGALLHTKHMQ